MATLNLIASFTLILSTTASCGPSAPTPPPGLREAPVEDLARRLTRAECEAAIEHAATLLEADPPSAPHGTALRANAGAAVEQCLTDGRLHDHRCLMTATDARELGLCPVPGSEGG